MMAAYILVTCLACATCLQAQRQFVPVTETYKYADNEPAPVHPMPSHRQLLWQETEFYAFFHFGMNTFTNSEWGNGGEAESQFAPTKAPNPRQWLEAVKAAGMKGGIAVVKHHDDFCLWPTATTTHSVVNAGNDNGRNTNIPEAASLMSCWMCTMTMSPSRPTSSTATSSQQPTG